MDSPLSRVVITGASGFLGSWLARSFAASGARVRAIGHTAPSVAAATFPGEIEFIALDLSSDADVARAFGDHDLLIHAAIVRSDGSGRDWGRVVERNVAMTNKILAAAGRAGIRRVVHVSSTAAIGVPPKMSGPADETFRFNLAGLGPSYALSKQLSEEAALRANGQTMAVTVVNPGFIFGLHRDVYRGENVLARCLQRRFVPCTDGGLSIVHVDDVVAGIRAAAAHGRAGERYILSGDNVSFREIANIVVRIADVRRVIWSVPNAVRDPAYVMSVGWARLRGRCPPLIHSPEYSHPFYRSGKAQSELGFAARPFADIVRDYLETRQAVRYVP